MLAMVWPFRSAENQENKNLARKAAIRSPKARTHHASVKGRPAAEVPRRKLNRTVNHEVRHSLGRRQRINGRPGLSVQIDTTSTEDIINVGKAVHQVVADYNVRDGYELITFRDRTGDVEARLLLLVKNGWQGLLLVFVFLTLFLELRLAVWVSMGIPLFRSLCCRKSIRIFAR